MTLYAEMTRSESSPSMQTSTTQASNVADVTDRSTLWLALVLRLAVTTAERPAVCTSS